VKARHDEGKGLDEALQDRQQEALRDSFDRAYELELGDLVDQVDVVEALDAVHVGLMDRIDPQEAGAALGAKFAPPADGDLGWACLVDAAPHPLIAL
jgi:hypothetical protein